MDSKKLANLRDILAKLYPDEVSIRRITDDSGIDPARITLTSSTTNNWHAVLAEAVKLQRVDDLLRVVKSEYGDNEELQKVIDEWKAGSSPIRIPPPHHGPTTNPGPPAELAWPLVIIAVVILGVLLIRTVATPKPTPTTTPLAFSTAAPREILFLIVDFKQMGNSVYDVSGRIFEALEKSIGEGRFPKVSVHYIPIAFSREEVVSDPTILGTLARRYNASVIIWGFYDDASISPAFSLARIMPVSLTSASAKNGEIRLERVMDFPNLDGLSILKG